jgi:hypothetical protein
MTWDVCENNVVICVAHYRLFRRRRCFITIVVYCIAIRMQTVYYEKRQKNLNLKMEISDTLP